MSAEVLCVRTECEAHCFLTRRKKIGVRKREMQAEGADSQRERRNEGSQSKRMRSQEYRGESLPAALANTIDGGTKATCLLCFCPSRPCSSVFLRAALSFFFFFLFLCSLDNVIKHTHEATLLTHGNNTHTIQSVFSKGQRRRPAFFTWQSGGALINSHFTPFVLSHRE